jgi:hypothetical protein
MLSEGDLVNTLIIELRGCLINWKLQRRAALLQIEHVDFKSAIQK